MMYVLTKKENDIDSGTFATLDDNGDPLIQMFLDKDDATTYNVHLEAVDQTLFITEVENDSLEKLCGAMGYAYNIVEPGEVVIPKVETMIATIRNDHFQDSDS